MITTLNAAPGLPAATREPSAWKVVGANPATPASRSAATAVPGLLVRLEGVGDLVQAHHGLGSPIGRSTQVAGHLAAERGRLQVAVDDAHRHHRPQLPLPCTDSARVISQVRSAPVSVARTTSLTVPPWTRRTLR